MHKFTWCRQEFAERCLLATEHFHVCIGSPSYIPGKVVMPACRMGRLYDILYMAFADFEPDKIMKTQAYAINPVKGQEIINQCFKVKDAEDLAAWVDDTPLGSTVIVNCEAGVSRSPAIVAAFRRFYGGDDLEPFRTAWPNLHVANTLAKVLGVSPFT